MIRFTSKTKIIHCVFSGLDVWSKWRLLYSLLHLTTNHLNSLFLCILVYTCSGVETMADWWQLTQGKMLMSINNRGRVWICVTSHRQAFENSLIWERGNYLTRLKKHWVDLYHYRVVVYTHCQHTFQSKQLVKVHVASGDPFKESVKWSYKKNIRTT